ncbi:hypothetical protein NS365_13245 [Aureimonas ureilytica]|uniref:Uncharacterized protein n=2 Tax=Aureimonas ureilytica TaxID=401562 RepID=A0A175RQ53_9HYPH|nr:hypothetical protein NS365_13245 [Aureimonas ureilytica]
MSTTGEGGNMQKPSWFSNNLTLGNVITLITMLCAGIYGYGKLENRVENVDRNQSRVEMLSNEKFAAITRTVEAIPNLAYRITAQEEALKQTNARLDASLQTLSQRIAEMNQLLGSVDTKIAVLTQRLEMQTPTGRRASIVPGP